jgi:tryptophan synthase alpha chain
MSPTVNGRLERTFQRCREEGRAALITYVMAGDPTLEESYRLAQACLKGGADLVELGFPFSDPIADGPTLQQAAERALRSGTTLTKVLALAKRLRQNSDAPLLLMGYLNPVLALGEKRFAEGCAKAGVDGFILPDLPPEEAEALLELAKARGLSPVFLLAPTSTPQRRQAVFAAASGFLYYVSVTGVTGARAALPSDVERRLTQLRRESPVPVVVGFGISTPAQAASLGRCADAVVVGSAIVARAAQPGSPKARAERVRRFVAGLRRALQARPHRASALTTPSVHSGR